MKQGGSGALNPCHEMALNRATSKESTTNLVKAILGLEDFKQDIHQTMIETGKASRVERKEVEYKQ
eukprot:8466135-Ditylum_brightwellii.AAC.1